MLGSPRSLDRPQSPEQGANEGTAPLPQPIEPALPFWDPHLEPERESSAGDPTQEEHIPRVPTSFTLSPATETRDLQLECRRSNAEVPYLKEEIHMRQVRSLFSRYLASQGENYWILTRAHLVQELLESYDEQLDLRRQLSVARIAQEEIIHLNKQLLAEIEDWRISSHQWGKERRQLLLEFKMESQDTEEDRRRLQWEIRRLRGEVEMWEGSAHELREELAALKEVSTLDRGQYLGHQRVLRGNPRKRKLQHEDGP